MDFEDQGKTLFTVSESNEENISKTLLLTKLRKFVFYTIQVLSLIPIMS